MTSFEWTFIHLPARHALIAFISSEETMNPAIESALHLRQSRWFKEAGGQRIVILFEGGDFNSEMLDFQAGGWSLDSCHICKAQLAVGAPCYQAAEDTSLFLCQACGEKLALRKQYLAAMSEAQAARDEQKNSDKLTSLQTTRVILQPPRRIPTLAAQSN